MNKKILSFISFLALGAVATAAPKKDIVDIAVEAGSFKTLVAAVQAADLVDTLKSDGPFTVFAPTDEAFAKLPKGTVETLLKPENKKMLVDIITYHVIGDKVKAKKAAKLDSAKTVNGQEIQISKAGDSLKINQSTVLKADIKASNGIIHVIDTVLLPETKKAASTSAKTKLILENAIHKGVPLFNTGHHEMTAKLYMKAGMDVLQQCSSSRCPEASKMISMALKHASAEHCNTSRAWIMRKAFDKVLASAN